METNILRRSQSLKSLSGPPEGSWVMPALSFRDRKSVSQLVQKYQSCGDLRISNRAEDKLKVSVVSTRVEVLESRMDGQRKRLEIKDHTDHHGSRRSFPLSRSRSMEYLPQREPVGTGALRALFESKVALSQDFSSSPRLNTVSPASRKTEKDCLPEARKGQSTTNTQIKDTTTQRVTQVERRKTTSGLPESYVRGSRYPQDDRRTPRSDLRDNLSRQSRDRTSPSGSVKDRTSPSGSVKDRLALYLSRVGATDSTGDSTHTEFRGTSGQKTKISKMADIGRQIPVSDAPHDENNLPPRPPPPIPPRPLAYEGPSSISGLPVPPSKETFSTLHQQRQKSELKRLFKHIHPDFRGNLNDVVDDEVVEAMQSEMAETDAGYHCEVQSMRWIFENWTLDNIGDPHSTKKLLDEENLQEARGVVRGTSSMFEHIDSTQQSSGTYAKRQTSVRGDVRTSTWLFETQSLDALNKLKPEEGEVVEAILQEPIQRGDVRGARLLFESRPLSALGRCDSIEDHNFLKLKSELQEQKGDVQKTVKLFQAEPCCAIRDDSGNIHEIKSICREEIKKSHISTARWLFETQPLDIINKGTDGVKILRGISLEEGQRGGVDRKRWMFETQPFNTIREGIEVDRFVGTVADYAGEADVDNKRKLFETQPLATLKGDSTEKSLEKEEIIGGDVRTSLWLFETQPMETLNDSCEVGHLKKISLLADEHGEVKGKKHTFENYNIKTSTSVREHEIVRGDVKSFKHLFEMIPPCNIAHSDEEMKEWKKNDITAGNVKGNKTLFETTPLYAIKDSSGNLHEVTTVSREESIKGNVQNYKWMFETKPFDQFADGKGDVEVIKGITKQEDTMGDVKRTKWLFETQTIDGIHSKFNQTEQKSSVQQEESRKGDVKTCKWLFETQPMDILYDKSDKVNDKEAIENTNVKSFTWIFESQPLDSIKDSEEQSLKLCSTSQDAVKSELGVKTVKHLFETETLDRIRKDTDTQQDVRYFSQVDVQSGDVSRVKEIFELQSLDEIGSEMVKRADEQNQDENIQEGSVHKFTWLFENRPINMINDKETDGTDMHRVSDVEGGDVHHKKFIFETFSLDKIHDQPSEQESVFVEKPVSNVDVKSSTMMFESQPLYAIRDKEGQFHEVTTVKKEEVMSCDVRGARWMFETKPLDAIKAENEVYVIRAVTQEDVQRGDVKSARWKFETQPLDSFASRDEPSIRVLEDVGSSNVQLNKQIFESEQSAHNKFVRMVSVTDVQQGDVRTSTWLFENQSIDSLKGEPLEQGPVKTVHREDNQKGEVKRCTWLFESQPLDKIKETDATSVYDAEEEIPKADVKSTTWLFETTPLDEITAMSVADTLSHLYQLSFIHSSGIAIEANENRNVNMAKYQVISEEGVQIQKEEVVEGNIRNIVLQLLYKPNLKPQITLLREVEKGKVNTTVVELPVNQPASPVNLDRDQRIQNIAQTIDSLLVQTKHLKRGIIMQESTRGQAEMTVYSLICNHETKTESQGIERGDVKSTIGNLLATANNQRSATSFRLDENEKGNVNLYRSCIEKGDLQYLKSLQIEASENEELNLVSKEQVEIVQGDVKEAKRSLTQQKEQVERTISDVLPGDVKNTQKVFSSECSFGIDNCIPKEEIVRGDILSAKQQLTVKQPIMVEKEEIVAGDIKATMQSLERAKQQSMHVERDVIKPGTIYDMDLSAQGPETEESQTQKEEIVSGDVKAAKKSLEMAKNQSMHVEREAIVPGKIYNMNVSAQEQSSKTVTQSTSSSSSRCQRITTTYKKVSDTERDQESHGTFQACQQGDVSQTAVIVNNCVQDTPTPVVNSEFDVETTEEEAEVIRGDVKAAIRSLQNAATEQKLLDKEDIVRGNMQLALQSLEKSSINISKGDFKAAMLYRNSGKACSGSNKTVDKQCVVVSMPPSDTELSPSVSVTYGEPPTITTQNSTPNPVEISDGNSKSSTSEGATPPPLPPKAIDRPLDQKPSLPPKPQRSKSTTDDAQNIPPPPSSKAYCPIKDNAQNPAIPPKIKQGKLSSTPSSQKPQENKKLNTKNLQNNVTSHEAIHQKSVEAMQGSNHIRATNEISAKESKAERIKRTQKNTIEHAEQTLDCRVDQKLTTSICTEMEMARNEIQKIDAAEEIRKCMLTNAEDAKHEMNIGFQAALQNFACQDKSTVDTVPVLPKKIKVVNDKVSHEKQTNIAILQKEKSHQITPDKQHCNNDMQKSARNITVDTSPINQNNCIEEQQKPEDKVVFREKKAKKETEGERRQRLSVHKEEIMRGNVKAAMEIFENLRKREELKIILSQVQEIEGETSNVDVSSLKTLFENVPAWIVTPSRNAKQSYTKGEKKVEMESQNDEMERGSSVETAFGDLEKASKEIINLKEQTLAKLIDIEEAIRKALFSVSNLKSEADIAGLSGLFDESLKSEQSCQPAKNIRKISIVSSKAKPEQSKDMAKENVKGAPASSPPQTPEAAPAQMNNKPLIRQYSAPSSPSFISIHSAARKRVEQPKSPTSTFKPKKEGNSQSCPGTNGDLGQASATAESSNHFHCPASPQRKVSVIEVKAVPEPPAGLIGSKTISETYEETDGFGNSYISSKTSTFITQQSENKTPGLFEVVGGSTRYEVMTSPLMQRSGHHFSDNAQTNAKEGGTVFVSFGQSKPGKH